MNEYRRDLENDVKAAWQREHDRCGHHQASSQSRDSQPTGNRYIAEHFDEFTPEQYLRFDQAAERAELGRDRAVNDLNLSDRQMASLYEPSSDPTA